MCCFESQTLTVSGILGFSSLCRGDTEQKFQSFADRLKTHILILDGAMGTVLQNQNLTATDFGGEEYEGCNEYLNITAPIVIQKIHEAYLQAGADIIETNTFNANSISQSDYELSSISYELNKHAAINARTIVDQFNSRHRDRHCYVAGALGPTNRTASLSPDVNRPDYRNVSFQELVDAYHEQVSGLIHGGVDLILIETIFDTLNAKASIYAIKKYFRDNGISLPVMISVTITDKSGRTLSGQTIEGRLFHSSDMA